MTVEADDPGSYFEPRRYRVRCQCERCGHVYHSQWAKAPPKNDPPCPKRACRDAALLEASSLENARLRKMLDEQTAPALVGANNTVKAVDETAKIVMHDYNMTNLKDGIRSGENVAPSLPPAQQKAADNYFGPQGSVPIIGQSQHAHSMKAKQLNMIGRRALAGGYRNMAVAPDAVTPDAAKGQPALTRVRVEQIGNNR